MTGATTLDSTGQYLPLDNPNNTMALGGPLQGQMIGVATFTNSGVIDLQSNPVAGDVLVITGGPHRGRCRRRHVHLQRRLADARHGAQRGRRRNALRYVGRRRHVRRRRRGDKDFRSERRRRGRGDRRRRHPGGAGARPDALRVLAPSRFPSRELRAGAFDYRPVPRRRRRQQPRRLVPALRLRRGRRAVRRRRSCRR